MADDGRPDLVRRWEALEGGVQAAIAFPIVALLLAIGHWTVLHQPLLRGALYGLFWAIPLTFVIVLASQNEGRKRRERDRGASDRSRP
jgi:hypothetical protein